MHKVNAPTFNYLNAFISVRVNLHSMIEPEGNQPLWQHTAIAMLWLLPLSSDGKLNSLLEIKKVSFMGFFKHWWYNWELRGHIRRPVC